MARTTLTVLNAVRSGLLVRDSDLTAANTDGHAFENDGATVLLLVNTNASGRTITVQTPGTVDGLAVADLSISIAAGNVTVQRLITATFPRVIYNQSDRTVYVDYSATAGLSVAAVRIPRESYS